MKNIFPLLLLSLMAFSPAMLKGYEIPSEVLATGMRTVVIETVGSEEPTCEPVVAPEGCWGIGITNADKVPGSVAVINPDGSIVYESGPYEKKESGMTVKVRGNTSALHDKKPFKIKLEKKGDLLGRGDKNLNDKNWVLLSNRNNLYELGFIIGRLAGMPWTPEYEYVNVIFNGDFRGLYILAEAVERNEKCRIRTEETGFVTERDPYWWNEDGEYLPSVWNPQFNWTLKYPDFEDLTEPQKGYIREVLDAFEAVILTEDYESLIDIDSFCRWLVAQDILGTADGGGTNFYLAKYDDSDSSRLFVPVLWDVDSAEETVDRWSAVHSQGMIAPLLNNSNTAFRRRYAELYRELSPVIFDRMEELALEMQSPAWGPFNEAVNLNNLRWGDDAVYTSAHNAEDMNWWFPPRRLWLDEAVGEMEETFGSGMISLPEEQGIVTVYSPSGIQVYRGPECGFKPSARGLFILRRAGHTEKVIL